MDFDCWTSLKIGEASYIIAEKIRYKEKTSDDVWTEYGLITDKSDIRLWLSIAEDGLSCSLSSPVGNKMPKGYRLHDSGTEVVTGVWGDTDASVGDETEYEQYESADGNATFFVEHWNGRRSSSAGRKISAAVIVADTDAGARQRARAVYLRSGLRDLAVHAGSGLAAVGIVLFFLSGIPDLDTRDWHDFRRFVNMPYALHERLSDAPYYKEGAAENGTRLYAAQIDDGTAALDLIEGVDGMVQDAFIEKEAADAPLVIRTQQEIARITSAADGTTHIILTETTPDLTPAAEKLERGYVLMRYAELVRTGDPRGRAGVVLQESPRADTPSAAPADSAASATEAANHTAAPVPTTLTDEETPRRMRHLAH